MNSRKFNPIMSSVNQKWGAEVLNMNITSKYGPDLTDKNKIVELKFNKIKGIKDYISWRVLENQVHYGKAKNRFWGLGTYKLKDEINNIETTNLSELEDIVLDRQLYLVEWNWINNFRPYKEKGIGKIGPYENIIRFPKFSIIPRIAARIEVERGSVYFTDGVPLDAFKINRKNKVGAIPYNVSSVFSLSVQS